MKALFTNTLPTACSTILVSALDPRWCRVEVNFNARGGIGIIVTAEHGTPPEVAYS